MGPLSGYRIVELQGIGPGPFAGMLLSDMGAEMIRVDRAQNAGSPPLAGPVIERGRRTIAVDLKVPEGVEVVLRLAERSDALFEGFRAGVAERLGIGPDVCLARNPRLVYGRMTGWGQDGPLAHAAGHDINYISLPGTLAHFGRRPGTKPMVPLNMVGDFGGGGIYLAYGIVCALLERERSGQGQVVDAAMVDGAASLMGMFWGMRAKGSWSDEVGTNFLDGGAPHYDVYECSDGELISIGSIEPQFYAELLERTGLANEGLPTLSPDTRELLRERFTTVFKTKTRPEWCELLEGTDVCFAPVLTMSEAPEHPHIKARGTIIEYDGVMHPAPAPRFSRTTAEIQRTTSNVGSDTDAVLADVGYSADEIVKLRDVGAIA